MHDEQLSPDKRIIASLFERNCGATTPYIQVISLRASGEKFDPDDFRGWIFTVYRGDFDKIKFKWEESDKLSIFYYGTGDKAMSKTEWDGIAISYKKE